MNDKKIYCEKHGKKPSAIVCGHLVGNIGLPLGFIENSSDPDDLQGWCYACELLYSQENVKTSRFLKFNDFSVVCIDCYNNVKKHHEENI